MSCYQWIEVKAGRRGQSPVLVEHRRAYAIFDGLIFPPRLVLAIGASDKFRFFNSIGLDDTVTNERGIFFRPVSSSTIVIDCELHDLQALEQKAVGSDMGHQVQHSLHFPLTSHSSARSIMKFAHELYWQVLVPFATTILLFVEDLGEAEPVINLVATWIQRSRLNSRPSPPRMLILFSRCKGATIEKFESQFRARLMATVCADQKHRATGLDSQADKSYCGAFESVRFLPTWKASMDFSLQIEESFGVREAAGFAFNGEHTKEFLQTAVNQFCECSGQQIDFPHAARLKNPVSQQLGEHIVRFILASRNSSIDQSLIIASALELDAHPPGMHFFPPALTFDKYYRVSMAEVEKRLGPSTMLARIRTHFIEMAFERHIGSSARAHLRLLGKFSPGWQECFHETTCFVCLARPCSYELTCGHRLCESCAVICDFRTTRYPKEVNISECPLCHKINGRPLLLRPATAGIRVLELNGESHCKSIILTFLEQLQTMIGLPLPLREYFDLIKGSGIGLFFVQTVFLEGWTIQDCNYHLKNLSRPKLDKKGLRISFGKRLEWVLAETSTYCDTNAVLLFANHRFSTRPEDAQKSAEAQNRDLTIRSEGELFDGESLSQIARRLIACLFYVELISAPLFYTAPELVHVQLCCRLAPGSSMVSLIKKLHLQRAQLLFRGEESEHVVNNLITPATLARVLQGEDFTRTFEIPVTSMQSTLDIKVEYPSLGKQSISNCPCKVKDLIKQQGLDCVFGRKDHLFVSTDDGMSDEMANEMERLSEVLDQLISLRGREERDSFLA